MCYTGIGGEVMQKQDFEQLLEKVAHNMGMSKEEVRREMENAVTEAMNDPDPMVRMRWNFVPRKGEKPTLEEFIDYILCFV
jgi:citrate synthase